MDKGWGRAIGAWGGMDEHNWAGFEDGWSVPRLQFSRSDAVAVCCTIFEVIVVEVVGRSVVVVGFVVEIGVFERNVGGKCVVCVGKIFVDFVVVGVLYW